ncbi:metallophosphoesterase [Sorangium sp. So ce1000]|uniref:metallophosphoesterase n=1 Tax=Sorangium sp. So ce1000 TaxID=3133325 RepID=UPI003F618F3B
MVTQGDRNKGEEPRRAPLARMLGLVIGAIVLALSMGTGVTACGSAGGDDGPIDDPHDPQGIHEDQGEEGALEASETTSAALNGTVSTDPDLKIAFIGDTGTGSSFTSVLNLVVSEGAAAVVVNGDMSYSANPTTWWNQVESVLGTTFPVFISRGNHDDSSWSGYLPKAANHLGGATRVAGAHDANYKTTFRGLVLVTAKKGDNGATHITPFLNTDTHIWKICQWHQNQAAMQIGGKGDEMGWDVYETCRKQGAIIQTGHEHSYERTRTLTNMTSQTVDPTCNGAGVLCVGGDGTNGRTFVTVAGLGGNSIRTQTRCTPTTFPYGCSNTWGFIYTSNQSANYGAQFITFNVGGNPKAATGYFKTISGTTAETFSITHD